MKSIVHRRGLLNAVDDEMHQLLTAPGIGHRWSLMFHVSTRANDEIRTLLELVDV